MFTFNTIRLYDGAHPLNTKRGGAESPTPFTIDIKAAQLALCQSLVLISLLPYLRITQRRRPRPPTSLPGAPPVSSKLHIRAPSMSLSLKSRSNVAKGVFSHSQLVVCLFASCRAGILSFSSLLCRFQKLRTNFFLGRFFRNGRSFCRHSSRF